MNSQETNRKNKSVKVNTKQVLNFLLQMTNEPLYPLFNTKMLIYQYVDVRPLIDTLLLDLDVENTSFSIYSIPSMISLLFKVEEKKLMFNNFSH